MASRFWVGGGASTNWDATGNTNWSATSGGAGNASVPTTGDDVFFDANSGVGASVMNVSLSLRSFDCNGFAGTLTHNSAITLTITGDDSVAPGTVAFRLASGMTFTTASGRVVAFTSATGTATLTSAGKSLGALTVNGANVDVSLGGALTVLGNIVLTDGTITTNNHNVTSSAFSSSNSNSRTLALGTSTYSLNLATGTVWDTSTATNLVLSGSHTIELAATATARRVINSGTLTFNTIHVNNPATNEFPVNLSAGGATITISTMTMTNASALGLDLGTYNIATLNFTATSAEPGLLIGVQSRPTLGMSGTSTTDYVSPYNINRTGAGTLTMNNALDYGNNSGITINAPAGGLVARVIGG